jgi:gamma-glutamylcysteine synthetase
MPAVYSTKRIPPELQASREAMEEFASAFAKERKWRTWLVVSKRTRIWFDERGERTGVTEDTFEESFGPYMRIGGKRFVLGLLNGIGC